MHFIKTTVGAAFIAALLFSCNSASHSPSSSSDAASATGNTSERDKAVAATAPQMANAKDAESITSPDRKIIKTADLRCRVKDVYSAATSIEAAAKAAGGMVADSKMDNEPNNTRTLPYSEDSLRQLQSYTTTAHLTLRIPVQKLDSFLLTVAAQSAFINSRHLQLSDVSLQYLGNEMKNHAAQGYAGSLRANYYNDDRDENIVDRKIENMNLLENVRYATLGIDLYQPERIDAIIVANTDAMMMPGIRQRTRTALSGGWSMMQDFALLLLNIWPLLIAAIAVLAWIKLRRQRRFIPARG